MTRRDWDRGDALAVGAFLNGAEIMAETREGEPIDDDSFLVLFNAWEGTLSFRLPPARFGRRWALELSTADPGLEAGAWELPVRAEVEVPGRSLLLLRRVA
jgi:glycogen operon protein